MSFLSESYEVVVIGAGHAGCEAALACARMGQKTLLLTLNIDGVALMPCNPSIGGTAKGHLVREVDALGGEMGRAIDDTFIQSRMLNTGKGPAVHSLRAQADKKNYQKRMLQREYTSNPAALWGRRTPIPVRRVWATQSICRMHWKRWALLSDALRRVRPHAWICAQ